MAATKSKTDSKMLIRVENGTTTSGAKAVKVNIPQQVYRLSEKAVPPFRGKCTAYPPRCTAHSLGYDVKII